VFGYPSREKARIYQKFAEYGEYRETVSDENALHIVYVNPHSAQQALQEDATWIHSLNHKFPFLIGVKYSDEIRPSYRSDQMKNTKNENEMNSFVILEDRNVEMSTFVQDDSFFTKFISFWTQGW